MPTYCYSTKAGQTVERVYPMGKAPARVRAGAQWADRDLGAEHGCPTRHSPKIDGKVILSSSMGVHPRQVAELKAFYKKRLGYAVGVAPDGRVELPARSSKRRKEICLARGFHDFDAGYSDP